MRIDFVVIEGVGFLSVIAVFAPFARNDKWKLCEILPQVAWNNKQ